MKINKLKLANFRNHEEFSIDVESSIVAITGKNGTGKTNILEALSLLVPGKGLRRAALAELQNQSIARENPWSIYAEVENEGDVTKIGTGFDAAKFLETGKEKRLVRINGETARGLNALAEHVSMIWLTPVHDLTFQSGTLSRGFLDDICSLFYPDYTSQLAVYNNARSQRRKLLSQNRMDDKWLSALEAQMVQKAMALTSARMEVLERVNNSMALSVSSGFPAARASVHGKLEDMFLTTTALEAENNYLAMLSSSRAADAITGKTAHGPHRTHLEVIHLDKKQVASLCSTGEQKAMLLSITLAAAAAKRGFSGITPIVVLDEVIAHLDSERRIQLVNFLCDINAQIWSSGVDFADFAATGRKVQNIAL